MPEELWQEQEGQEEQTGIYSQEQTGIYSQEQTGIYSQEQTRIYSQERNLSAVRMKSLRDHGLLL